MRLDKYLADMGAGKRSDLKKAIRRGEAEIDGETVLDPGRAVPAGAAVFFRDRQIRYEAYVYYMMNKPAGVISATEDKRQKTVIDLLEEPVRRDLFPVGRLDRDTEGLLLLTNDGSLAHRLLAPGRHVDKVYRVRARGILPENAVSLFRSGLRVDDSLTALPADLRVLQEGDGENLEAEVTIREGKYHQVKRMFQALGCEVTALKRLRMGSLELDPALEPGRYRRLTEEELAALKAAADQPKP